MNCAVCSFIKSDKIKKIFEDREIVAFLNPTPSVPGEVLITTKKHYTVLGQVPNFVVGELFSLANKMSVALFELLDLQGTNILLSDGTVAGQQVPHILIHVIPRKKGDNLNFDWERKKVSEDDLKTALLKLKSVTDNLVITEDNEKYSPEIKEEKDDGSKENKQKVEEKPTIVKPEREEIKEEKKDNEKTDDKGYKEVEVKENYLGRQLRRLP